MSCQKSRARWKIRDTLGGPRLKSTNHSLSNLMPRVAYPKVSLMKRRPAVDLRAAAWKHIRRSGGKRSNRMFPVRVDANSEPRPSAEQGNAGLSCLLDTCNIASGADSVGRPRGRTSPGETASRRISEYRYIAMAVRRGHTISPVYHTSSLFGFRYSFFWLSPP